MTADSQASKWRLWIDRCGGFGLLAGQRFTVGGCRPKDSADISVRSDWRRFEGTLVRRESDYFFFVPETQQSSGHLVTSGSDLPIPGSATLRLTKPSPLSGTAFLSLAPPHRFGDHLDHLLLVAQTVLIGPTALDHIRCTAAESSAILVFRDGIWRAKLKSDASQGRSTAAVSNSQFIELVPGRRVSLGDFDMTLEAV